MGRLDCAGHAWAADRCCGVLPGGCWSHSILACEKAEANGWQQLRPTDPAVSAPRDWRKKNMQAVLAIDVKDGVAGHPRVVASYFW